MVPYVYEHSRSSAVSSASAEHGASTGTWEGAPLREEPPRRIQPHPNTWPTRYGMRRCIWAPVSQRGTHGALPQGRLRLALGLILECVPANLARCRCSTSPGPGSRASLSHRWHARSRCHGQDQRVRAGEPVGALSRNTQAPPFNAQAWLDVDALRPRVPALELVSAVAGLPGRDVVGKAKG